MKPLLSPATGLQLEATIPERQYDPPAIGEQPVWVRARAQTPGAKKSRRKPVPREESPQSERRRNRRHSIAMASVRRHADDLDQRLFFFDQRTTVDGPDSR